MLYIYIYIAHSAGYVVSSIPATSVLRIPTGKLKGQHPESDINSATKSQYFDFDQTQNKAH